MRSEAILRTTGWLILTGILTLLLTAKGNAAPYTWTGSFNNAWEDAANWTGTPGYPDTVTDQLILPSPATANNAPFYAAAKSIQDITIHDTYNINHFSSNTLTLNPATPTTGLVVTGGDVDISSSIPIIMATPGQVSSSGNTLEIYGSLTAQSDLIVENTGTSTLQIRNLTANGPFTSRSTSGFVELLAHSSPVVFNQQADFIVGLAPTALNSFSFTNDFTFNGPVTVTDDLVTGGNFAMNSGTNYRFNDDVTFNFSGSILVGNSPVIYLAENKVFRVQAAADINLSFSDVILEGGVLELDIDATNSGGVNLVASSLVSQNVVRYLYANSMGGGLDNWDRTASGAAWTINSGSLSGSGGLSLQLYNGSLITTTNNTLWSVNGELSLEGTVFDSVSYGHPYDQYLDSTTSLVTQTSGRLLPRNGSLIATGGLRFKNILTIANHTFDLNIDSPGVVETGTALALMGQKGGGAPTRLRSALTLQGNAAVIFDMNSIPGTNNVGGTTLGTAGKITYAGDNARVYFTRSHIGSGTIKQASLAGDLEYVGSVDNQRNYLFFNRPINTVGNINDQIYVAPDHDVIFNFMDAKSGFLVTAQTQADAETYAGFIQADVTNPDTFIGLGVAGGTFTYDGAEPFLSNANWNIAVANTGGSPDVTTTGSPTIANPMVLFGEFAPAGATLSSTLYMGTDGVLETGAGGVTLPQLVVLSGAGLVNVVGTGSITPSSGITSIDVQGAATLAMDSTFAGSNDIIKSGTGTARFTRGSGTFTGLYEVDDGELVLQAATSGAHTPSAIKVGATLTLSVGASGVTNPVGSVPFSFTSSSSAINIKPNSTNTVSINNSVGPVTTLLTNGTIDTTFSASAPKPTLAFADSSAQTWNPANTLTIRESGHTQTVRFGTDDTALTSTQQGQLRIDSGSGPVAAYLDSQGYVVEGSPPTPGGRAIGPPFPRFLSN